MEKTANELIKEDIMRLEPQLFSILKEDTGKFLQIACNFVDNKPKLLQCNRSSLYSEIIKIAQMGLIIDGDEASLVPFKDTVKRMIGYKGLLKMIRNSGELASINAGVVYENDIFEHWIDEKGEHIKHVPQYKLPRKVQTHAYCIARTKVSDDPYIEVMTEEELMNCKKQNKFAEESPWTGPFADEMRKKTVMRRISKRLPMSTDMRMTINSEDEMLKIESADIDQHPEKVQPPQVETKSRLEQAILPPEHNQKENQLDKAKELFSQTIEGAIESVIVKDIPSPDGKSPARRRFTAKIGNVLYGTWEEPLYKQMESAYDRKQSVRVEYITRLNSKNQPINEVSKVTTIVQLTEETPL